MADPADATSGTDSGSGSLPVVPSGAIGRWALALAALGLVGWPVLQVVAGTVGDANPGLSSGAMVAGMVTVAIAAVFNILAVTVWRQRSILNIGATALILMVAVPLLLMLWLGGFFNQG